MKKNELEKPHAPETDPAVGSIDRTALPGDAADGSPSIRRYSALSHTIGLGIFLSVIWLLLSGHFDPLLLGLGMASIALILVVAHRMDVVDHEGQPLQVTLKTIPYMFWLCKEIVKSNIDVIQRILSPKLNISPTMIEVEAPQHTDLVRSMYANSITLTPGTVSIRTENDCILVHALSKEGAEGLLEGEMADRLLAIEAPSITNDHPGRTD